jgi:hypothetical protein
MTRDITAIIDTMRNNAVGRCRERIEQAAQKARELAASGHRADAKKESPNSEPQCGVTSILKRRHGL